MEKMKPEWNGNTMGGAAPRLADDSYFTPDKLALAICQKLRTVTVSDPSLIIEPSAGGGSFVRAARTVFHRSDIHAVEPNGDVRALSLAGANSVSTLPWEESRLCDGDRFRRSGEEGSVLIIGNPPFLLATKHIMLALERLGNNEAEHPQSRWLCFVLRSSMLAGKERFSSLHSNGCLRYVWNVVGRPSFCLLCRECGQIYPLGTAFAPEHVPVPQPGPKKKQPRMDAAGICVGSGKTTREGTDAAEYAVLIWQVGYRGPYEGGWLTWK